MEAYEKHPAAFKLDWVQEEGRAAQETLDVELGQSSHASAPASHSPHQWREVSSDVYRT